METQTIWSIKSVTASRAFGKKKKRKEKVRYLCERVTCLTEKENDPDIT